MPSVLDTTVFRGADIDSDHHLVGHVNKIEAAVEAQGKAGKTL